MATAVPERQMETNAVLIQIHTYAVTLPFTAFGLKFRGISVVPNETTNGIFINYLLLKMFHRTKVMHLQPKYKKQTCQQLNNNEKCAILVNSLPVSLPVCV